MSLSTTCISVYLNLSKLLSNSSALEEDPLEFLLVCVKAKYGWIPFARKLEKNIMISDIHFGPL